MKKVIISAVAFSLILLVDCSEEPEVMVIDASAYGEESINKEIASEKEIDLLAELHSGIIESVTSQTEIEEESIAIMLGGNAEELSISLGFPKNLKVDNAGIQNIVKQCIKEVAETKRVAIGEVTATIEKY